jgi:hypothetical protein
MNEMRALRLAGLPNGAILRMATADVVYSGPEPVT